MTEREKHLMYCKFCANSAKNLNLGIICALTGKRADFLNTCDSYSEKIKLINAEKKSLELRIDEKYNNLRDVVSSVLENVFGIFFFDSLFKSKYNFQKKEQTHRLEIQKSSQHIKILIFIFSILTIFGIVCSIINFDKFWISYSIIGFCVLLINMLILKFRKPEIRLKTNSEGFSYSNINVKWSEVLVYKSVTTDEKHAYKRIAIGTKSRGIIEINISDLDIGIKDFLSILELNESVIR